MCASLVWTASLWSKAADTAALLFLWSHWRASFSAMSSNQEVIVCTVAALFKKVLRQWQCQCQNLVHGGQLPSIASVQLRPSTVHSKGVFAKQDLRPGSTLGAYPGRPRSPAAMAAKAQQAPASKAYAFCTSGGTFLDPTDVAGQPCSQPRPGLPWLSNDPLLAFVNEPPPGQLTSVSVVDGRDDLELVFVVTADVRAGEELFVDYGPSFDRSDYHS